MTQKVEYGPDDCMNKNGSSLRGYVTATYDNLVELFGEPNAYAGDKTWNAWDLCFTVWDEDGEDSEDVYVDIYDWKESGPHASKGDAYRWHVGGFVGSEHHPAWMVSDLIGQTDANEYTFERRQ